ncbi:MAG TPA: hypothetical protein VNZ26_12170, partial [Vicinamibacterales bacterium]|nr:hypothetical protein [Vicinamibacterales bacterium]
WMGGHWTLHDIVDYELIATMALLETGADRRETIMRQIYEVNRETVEKGKTGAPSAIVVPVDHHHDPREAAHLVERLNVGGVDIYRADTQFEADGKRFEAGSFVIPMNQVFARYAKDMLESQIYPEVRRGPNAPPEAPYDVTAWSLGMLMGVDTVFLKSALPEGVRLTRLFEDSGSLTNLRDGETVKPDRAIAALARPRAPGAVGALGTTTIGEVIGNGSRYGFDYKGPDTALAINRLLKDGAHVGFEAPADHSSPARVSVTGISRAKIEQVAKEQGLTVKTSEGASRKPGVVEQAVPFHAPRIAMYQPWTGGNMDEGWTRWVLEQYEFTLSSIHNADIRAGKLRQKFDAIILADQNPNDIIEGYDSNVIRPEYRGGIGEAGVEQLKEFVAEGGTLITMGNACDLAIEKLPIPVRDLKKALTRDQHFAPGAILRVEVDTLHPMGYGMAPETFGFYINSPFFSIVEGFASQKTSVVARYPNTNVLASGWLKGEELMAGRAAVVTVDMNQGHVVLFGLRPQHRAQTHATFPLLFNALYLSAADGASTKSTN